MKLFEKYSGENMHGKLLTIRGGLLRLCKPLRVERTEMGITVTRSTYYFTEATYFFQVPRSSTAMVDTN